MTKYILFLFIPFFGFAQRVIDDSTKQVYGPKTTKYFLEDEVFKNRKTLYTLDTTFSSFHQQNLYQLQRGAFQELGNVGTAVKKLYVESPAQIGTALGYGAYRPYYFAFSDTKYYDTKSPFTEMGYIQGANGQNIVQFTHARNIKPNFNLTFEANRITASKQYGSPRTREDKLVDMWATRLHANYTSKNKKYLLLANYAHFNQASTEQGGIVLRTEPNLTMQALYEYANYAPKLTAANSTERQNAYHLYQQCALANGLELYNVTDYQHQYNTFSDANKIGYTNRVYATNPTNDTTFLNNHYRLFENKAGLKGKFSGYNYRVHWRQRWYNLASTWHDAIKNNSETFLGAWTAYYFKDSTRIDFEGELSLNKQQQAQFKADYTGKWLQAGMMFGSVAPTLQQSGFSSNVLNWKNSSFTNAISTIAFAQTTLKHKAWRIVPNVQITNLNNYIYFDTVAVAKQSKTNINLLRLGLSGVWQHPKMQISWQGYYTQKPQDSENLMRVPTLFLTTQFAYNFVYAKVLHLQSGIDLSYRSAYFAEAYMPLTQQFYLQDKVKVGNYPIIDIFTNMRINRVRLFFRLSHANQRLFPSKVAYTTPYYPIARRGFQLGINWPLFD